MIVEYIRYTLTQHSPDELIAAYTRASEFLAKAPECLGYELTQCSEDTKTFILRIEWTSDEDHLIGFRKGAQFPPFLAEIKAFISEISEMRHYHLVPTLTYSKKVTTT